MEETGIRFVGIDLAKRSFEARMEYPDSGQQKGERFSGQTGKAGVDKLIARLKKNDRVGMESCAYAFYLAKEIIRRVGCEVFVLNAGQLAIIYKSTKKTDLEDASKIAWLLKRFLVEELPVVTLPSELEEHRRALVSDLSFKKRQRNRLINRLHSLFVRVGITGMLKKDLRTKEAREENEKLLEGYTQSEARRIEEELDLVEKHIAVLESEITDDLKTEPLAQYLLSVPGVGTATAMAFLAHVGDGHRFARGRQVSNFVGMTPRVDNSGDTVHLGSITKRGCTAIRSIIVQSAWAAVHSKTPNRFQDKYLEIYPRRGKGRAIVAVARRMLEIMWLVTVRKEVYNQTSLSELDRKLIRLGLKMRLKKLMEPAA
jgi:transposase